jgi:hypothetical protein
MRFLAFLKSHLFDVIAAVAILAIIHGIAMIHKPSAWIIGGVLVLAFSIFVTYFDGKTAGAQRGQ